MNEGLGRQLKSEELMNCKQGDLAVVVRSYNGQHGAIVECVQLFEHPLFPGEPCWEVRPPLLLGAWCHDDQLRPLRDNDGEDEILRLVGKPVGEPQAA